MEVALMTIATMQRAVKNHEELLSIKIMEINNFVRSAVQGEEKLEVGLGFLQWDIICNLGMEKVCCNIVTTADTGTRL